MKKYTCFFVVIMFFLVSLPGCSFTPYWSVVRNVAPARAAIVADDALDAALWYVCKGASMGAVRRRYGGDPEGYIRLCQGEKDKGLLKKIEELDNK